MRCFTNTRCLEIPEKVSINIASEASYFYNLPKVVKLVIFEKLKLVVKQCYQTS